MRHYKLQMVLQDTVPRIRNRKKIVNSPY